MLITHELVAANLRLEILDRDPRVLERALRQHGLDPFDALRGGDRQRRLDRRHDRRRATLQVHRRQLGRRRQVRFRRQLRPLGLDGIERAGLGVFERHRRVVVVDRRDRALRRGDARRRILRFALGRCQQFGHRGTRDGPAGLELVFVALVRQRLLGVGEQPVRLRLSGIERQGLDAGALREVEIALFEKAPGAVEQRLHLRAPLGVAQLGETGAEVGIGDAGSGRSALGLPERGLGLRELTAQQVLGDARARFGAPRGRVRRLGLQIAGLEHARYLSRALAHHVDQRRDGRHQVARPVQTARGVLLEAARDDARHRLRAIRAACSPPNGRRPDSSS